MRDINRIDPFLEELGKAWKKNQDQRFAQFIMNMLGDLATKHGDPFFWEDDKFIKYMKEIPWCNTED